MPRTPRRTRRLRAFIRFLAVLTPLSALFGFLVGGAPYEWDGLWIGAAQGFLTAAPILAIEIFVVNGPAGHRLRALPFAAFVGIRTVLYTAIVVAALALGRAWFWNVGRGSFWSEPEVWWSMAFSAAMFAAGTFLESLRRLLGAGVLGDLILGRYHRPMLENRIFLLFDLAESTTIAEKLGPQQFLSLLNRVLHDVTEAIEDLGGVIYRYVGDEIIVTWSPATPDAAAQALRCPFAVGRRMAERRDFYRRTFGVEPKGRAALHAGPIAHGELGDSKLEIAFVGDTLNTAARLLDYARESGHPILASAAVVDLAETDRGLTLQSLGDVALRGKAAPVHLYTASAAD
jgi:adenylate cyclase